MQRISFQPKDIAKKEYDETVENQIQIRNS